VRRAKAALGAFLGLGLVCLVHGYSDALEALSRLIPLSSIDIPKWKANRSSFFLPGR